MTWRALFWWRPPCLLRRVIVNLRSDATMGLRGLLVSSRGAWLVLLDVDALQANQPPRRVDGDVVVHRSNVAFLQVLPNGDRQ